MESLPKCVREWKTKILAYLSFVPSFSVRLGTQESGNGAQVAILPPAQAPS